MRSNLRSLARPTLLGAWVLVGAAACGGEDIDSSQSVATAASAAAPLPPAATMHPDDIAGVTASYDCGGMRVDVIRDQVARVNLAVDNIVKIERIQGSVPATYQDVGLTFAVTGTDAAELDDESGNSRSCKRVDEPVSASTADPSPPT